MVFDFPHSVKESGPSLPDDSLNLEYIPAQTKPSAPNLGNHKHLILLVVPLLI